MEFLLPDRRERGRLVTVDPVLVDGQSAIARFLINRDRGNHVRTPAAYRALLSPHFVPDRVEIRHDLVPLPYTLLLMVARRAAESQT